ncbi:cysteine-rich CWC family protein [Melaminivora alkalimesophila]|uniref:cysteine-rich CWC family protein n=1 Tax=Melaminivora alkalimesophila TaxID=1165852 RepID=UPI00096A6AA8|nr:cysteine-rich CWC family protein [Melaminivora alkalimesophila]
MERIDPCRCPLCGQPNRCALQAGQPAPTCWCMQERVSRAALARIPAPQRGRACLCPRCARTPEDAPGTLRITAPS